jgi:hypothetical protein
MDQRQARMIVHTALASYAEQRWQSKWVVNKKIHRRSEPQEYDPTPACTECHLAWDETGNYKPEFRCPASPGAIVALAMGEAERRVPVQRDDHSGAGTVPWSTHVRAWQNYGTRHEQTAERLAERGGFGYREMQCALAGHYRDVVTCKKKHPVPEGWQPI